MYTAVPGVIRLVSVYMLPFAAMKSTVPAPGLSWPSECHFTELIKLARKTALTARLAVGCSPVLVAGALDGNPEPGVTRHSLAR